MGDCAFSRQQVNSPIVRVPLWFCIAIVFCSLVAFGQSGRRNPKTTSTPEPEETATPEPTPTPKPPVPTRLTILLVTDVMAGTANIPGYLFKDAVSSCAGELETNPGVMVTSGKNMTQGEAIKEAKNSKDSYVVYLDLRPDSLGMSNSSGGLQPSDISVRYFVFAPVTAKVVATGSVYQAINSGVPIGPGTAGGNNSAGVVEYRVQQAGKEAADRIMSKLDVLVSAPPRVAGPRG